MDGLSPGEVASTSSGTVPDVVGSLPEVSTEAQAGGNVDVAGISAVFKARHRVTKRVDMRRHGLSTESWDAPASSRSRS